MNEEELTLLGNDAEALLSTESFTRIMNVMVDSTVQSFLASGPDESDKRNQAYGHYRALVDIMNTLRQQVEVRDQIDAKVNEPNDEEEVTTEEE